MRKALLLLTLTFVFAVAAHAQDAYPLPTVVTLLEPDYPIDTLKASLFGEIHIVFKVDTKGKVSVLSALGPLAPCSDLDNAGTKKLREAAIEAVKHSTFQPPMQNGKPVEGMGQVKYTLKMPPDPDRAPGKLVKGGVLNGKALSLARPDYPPSARSKHAAGAVPVMVLIDEQGTPFGAAPLSGHPELQRPSTEAACKSKFSPTLFAGQPVKVSGIITYNFVP